MTDPCLSRRQENILNFIRGQVETVGYPPSVREIGKHVGLSSTSSVHNQLYQLELKGYLRRDPTRARAISVRLPGEAA